MRFIGHVVRCASAEPKKKAPASADRLLPTRTAITLQTIAHLQDQATDASDGVMAVKSTEYRARAEERRSPTKSAQTEKNRNYYTTLAADFDRLGPN
jgi:hypothetical protein